jgi:hypothetical protein
MQYLKLVLILCFLILAGAAIYICYDLYFFGRLPFFYSPIQFACHCMLKQRLRSPSTLNIAETKLYVQLLNLENARLAIKNDPLDDTPNMIAMNAKTLENRWVDIVAGKADGPTSYASS